LVDHIEAPDTYQARKRLKHIYHNKNFIIQEEVKMDTVTNNMEEEIYPPYQADMLLTKQFIIELDPETSKKYKSKGHGTRRRRLHDDWRDRNIKNQMDITTVRLIPRDILQQSDEQIEAEIEYQLKHNFLEEEPE
jgi:hypothetical protein